ncbi:hypothetical protein BJ508DRAFT_365643 [Ascobolus immersus RN42]|uniref:Uncharacterized protein n=1 Tax=Ascobolus immersus RN42 TaxID=1160509 RepID=A0A3N4HNX0_ASCIM|nr:hypothetical protein BJ508DRAFT_365643 [Ascobolus immersus RN42]
MFSTVTLQTDREFHHRIVELLVDFYALRKVCDARRIMLPDGRYGTFVDLVSEQERLEDPPDLEVANLGHSLDAIFDQILMLEEDRESIAASLRETKGKLNDSLHLGAIRGAYRSVLTQRESQIGLHAGAVVGTLILSGLLCWVLISTVITPSARMLWVKHVLALAWAPFLIYFWIEYWRLTSWFKDEMERWDRIELLLSFNTVRQRDITWARKSGILPSIWGNNLRPGTKKSGSKGLDLEKGILPGRLNCNVQGAGVDQSQSEKREYFDYEHT